MYLMLSPSSFLHNTPTHQVGVTPASHYKLQKRNFNSTSFSSCPSSSCSMINQQVNRSISCRASMETDVSQRKENAPAHGVSEAVVGVLGGGQLGRMLCQAASQMSIKINILDPMVNCPASSICHHHMVGSYDNSTTVEEFAKRCGILTVEIEHVDADTLEKLEKQGLECVWGYQFLARIDGEIFHHSDPTLGKRRSSIVDNYIWIRLWWWKYCFKDVGLHQHY